MLKKIQNQIQTRVDAEIADTVPTLTWPLIKAMVHIEYSLERPCFKVIFYPVDVEEPADDATKAVQDKWKKFLQAKNNEQSLVNAMVFSLTRFAKDSFDLTNSAGAGLVFKRVEAITNAALGGFAVTLEAKDLTNTVYNQLKG